MPRAATSVDGTTMSWDAWLTLGVTGLVLAALVRDLAPDVIFLGAVVLLAALGVIGPDQAFAGFANEGVLLVAAMFVVAAGLRETGVMDFVGDRFLGPIKTEGVALVSLAALLVPLSAVLNNTSKVAVLLPVVIDWCRKRQISPSRLLMPLSFLSILGGTCTLIGTSTNLVVQGLMIREKMQPMGLFEVGYVGLPLAVIGVIYLLTLGRRLLPDRKELIEQLGESRREYLVEMMVQPGCRLAGRTVEGAGLRQLPGLFLIAIDRDGTSLAPVGPDDVIEAGDRLVFTGVVGTIVDLEKIPGLVPAADEAYEVRPQLRRGRRLCEAVISPSSPLVGKAIRNADFRALYNAAVVAVHRNGERMDEKIGDIVLRAGDTLLLQTGPHFARAFRNNPAFYLVSDVEDSRPLREDRAWVAVAILVGLIVAMSSGVINPTIAAFLAAGLLVATRCIAPTDARRAVEWPMLVAIAASFGLGAALEKSGAAEYLAGGLVDLTRPWGATATLAALYFGTMVLNELISNNAAAVLAFPFAVEAARMLEVSPRPMVMAIVIASSNAFASPIGYQTHMMVFGPGGYRFTDFLRVGVPMNLILWVAAVVLIPQIWPL
jgi:di/tricarboxylate transporter